MASVWVVIGLSLLPAARAQFAVPPDMSVRSISGQFVVEPRDPSALVWSQNRLNSNTNKDYVPLEPTLLTVSCERTKQILLSQLQMATATWRGRIYLALYSATGPDDPVTITSIHFRDGWQYRVELPDLIQRDRYVRAIVQALLLEQANRDAVDRSAEIPLWLTEGFTRRLLASNQGEIILSPPGGSVNGLHLTAFWLDAHKTNALQAARHELAARPPVSFDQLSWPADNEMSSDRSDIYGDSAQLFVGELLRLRDGPACLRALLAELPQHFNWQFAFLKAFKPHFARLVDVEKWWAVQSAQFTFRDVDQPWSLDESWKKLDDTLHTPIEVRAGTNESPLLAEVPLQTILKDWETVRATETIEGKVRELQILRAGIARPLLGLVQGYGQVLQAYLEKRSQAGMFPVTDAQHAAAEHATAEVLLELNLLDAQREGLRTSLKPLLAKPVKNVTAGVR